MSIIDKQRLARVAKMELKHGSHKSLKAGACVMEAVAYVAGEKWSDTPDCACLVIAAFMRTWNDNLRTDEDRTRLLGPLVPMLVGTRSTPAVELRRSYMAFDWLVRVYTPQWLALAGLDGEAAALRALPELVSDPSVEIAAVALVAARAAAGTAAGDAAWVAARVAAGTAAEVAAWVAARAAAGDAAWVAARAAAGDAAWVAARAAGAAARAAAWDTAWDVAWAAISPTVTMLQTSAVELVRAMASVQPRGPAGGVK